LAPKNKSFQVPFFKVFKEIKYQERMSKLRTFKIYFQLVQNYSHNPFRSESPIFTPGYLTLPVGGGGGGRRGGTSQQATELGKLNRFSISSQYGRRVHI
jgi:hypothetical protein